MRRRASALVLAGLLLATGCGGSGEDTAVPSPVDATTSEDPESPTGPASPDSPPPTGPGTRALFFGDSYFVGGGYTGEADSMAALAADRLGWEREIRGGGGTGFATANPEYDLLDYPGQIADGALDVGPVDWLVVEGGGNDQGVDPATVEADAVAVLESAVSAHPEAEVVLMGTMDPTVEAFDDTDALAGALRGAAATAGVPFIDPQRWLEGRPDLVGPDFVHPTPEGHRVLADRLADALLEVAAS